MKRFFVVLAGLLLSSPSFAKDELSNRLTIGSDLAQPFLFGGFNMNAYYYFSNGVTLGWSHGENLSFAADGSFANSQQKEEHANVFLDWSTGPEIGYRLTKYLDLRIDFKMHQHEIEHVNNGNRLTEYETTTVGPTFYYHWYPWTDHFVVELSTRYWLLTSSSAPDDLSYIGKDGKTGIHDDEKMAEGTAGFGLNVSFGWTI